MTCVKPSFEDLAFFWHGGRETVCPNWFRAKLTAGPADAGV
jgi:hypothetical protein